MDWKEILAAQLPAGGVAPETETPAAEAQATARRCRLRIELDRHGRKGKPVTLVSEFQGDDAELQRLTKHLQKRLACGGSYCFNSDEPYDGQILLQGDCRQRVRLLLEEEGYPTRLL